MFRVLMICAATAIGIAPQMHSDVIAADEVDGALWKYTLTRVGGKETRSGMFRIKDSKIYQPREGKPTVVGSIDGKKFVPTKGDTIPVTFTDLRGSDGPPLELKGKIAAVESGSVTGRFEDSVGNRWKMEAHGFKK